jgi:hypothetical protein
MNWGQHRYVFAAVFAVSTLVSSMSTAQAASTAAVDPYTGAVISGYLPNIGPLSIPVRAVVSPNCSFDPSNLPQGTLPMGDLNGAFDAQIPFGMRCNTPLNVGVVSLNGGMLAPTGASTGYSALRSYNVELHLAGPTQQVDGDCLSTALATSGACTFRGPATNSAGSGGLYLPEAAMSGGGYVSGSFLRVYSAVYASPDILVASTQYADTLTVTLSAVY